MRSALVAIQIAMALILLIGAGLMINSFLRIQNNPLGADPKNLLTFDFRFSRRGDQGVWKIPERRPMGRESADYANLPARLRTDSRFTRCCFGRRSKHAAAGRIAGDGISDRGTSGAAAGQKRPTEPDSIVHRRHSELTS